MFYISEVSFKTFEEILSYAELLKVSFSSSAVRFASPIKV